MDDSVNFFLNWVDYKNGFGSTDGEFWLGNDNIHWLTSDGNNVLKVDLETFGGETAHAEYDGFSIDDESTHYALRFSSYLGSSNASKFHQNYCARMYVGIDSTYVVHLHTHIHTSDAHTYERAQNEIGKNST